MNAKEIRELSVAELNEKLADLKEPFGALFYL